MDSRKLVLLLCLFLGRETGLERLSFLIAQQAETDSIPSVFIFDLVPLWNRWITESQLRKQPIDICFLVTKASRVSLQSKPPPFQVFPLATDRRPMILEQLITLAKLYQLTLFCSDIPNGLPPP